MAVLLVAILAGLLAAILAGCGSSGESAAGSSPSPGPITVTDDMGQEVTLASPATRVISLAPANTEIAFAIGAGEKLVAGTSFDDYPDEAKALPKIGDFANPSVEKIVSMQPDLVLAAAGVQAGLRAQLEKLGVQVYVVDPTTYSGVVDSIEDLGRLLGVSAQAAEVTATMESAVADVTAKVGTLDKPVTFVEIYSKPLMTVGTGTFIDDVIRLAGGTNLGASAGSGWPNYSGEVLLQKDPAVYVAISGAQSTPGDIARRAGYSGLKAVKDQRVYVIDDNMLVRPGPRLAQGLRDLAAMIHPEAYEQQ
jgi:iron complex transport system substrate-binding protein